MRAAGVVADHAAERAAAVRRRIRPEREVMALRRDPQRVEDDARLNAREPLPGSISRIRFMYFVKSKHDRDVAALAGEARAGAARQHRRAELPAGGHRRDHVVGVARNDEADRNLAVVRAVGGVQRAAAAVEADFAADRSLQFGFEFGGGPKVSTGFACELGGRGSSRHQDILQQATSRTFGRMSETLCNFPTVK